MTKPGWAQFTIRGTSSPAAGPLSLSLSPSLLGVLLQRCIVQSRGGFTGAGFASPTPPLRCPRHLSLSLCPLFSSFLFIRRPLASSTPASPVLTSTNHQSSAIAPAAWSRSVQPEKSSHRQTTQIIDEGYSHLRHWCTTLRRRRGRWRPASTLPQIGVG